MKRFNGIMRGMVVACLLLGAGAGVGQAPGAPVADARQKELLDQANQLLKMAAELKVSVDKTGKYEMSLDVIRKAEAVEKMARDLKSKIR